MELLILKGSLLPFSVVPWIELSTNCWPSRPTDVEGFGCFSMFQAAENQVCKNLKGSFKWASIQESAPHVSHLPVDCPTQLKVCISDIYLLYDKIQKA